MDQINPLFIIFVIAAIALYIAYRHGKLAGIAQTLQGKVAQVKADVAQVKAARPLFGSWFKPAPAAPVVQPVVQALPTAPPTHDDIVKLLAAAQAHLATLQK